MDTYGTMYGMEKTTVYLPSELKQALGRAAATSGRSEADLIREGVRAVTDSLAHPRPRLPLFESAGDPHLAERIDAALEGFGQS